MTQTDEPRRMFDDGIDAYRVGDYEEALELLGEARDQFAEMDDQSGEAEALGSMGAIYVQLEDCDKVPGRV